MAIPVAAAPAPAAAAPAPSNGTVKPTAPVVPSKTGAPPPAAGAQGGPPPPKPEGTTPPGPQKFKRKEKIDGREVELEADEDALWAAYRKQTTVDRRFEENARVQREIAAEAARVKKMEQDIIGDPTGEKMLELYMRAHPDSDPVDVLSAILQKRLHEEEQLNDPNIRERRRLENENKTLKEREATAKKQAAEVQQKQAVAQELEKLADTFGEALQLTKLPRNDVVLSLMAKAEHTNRKNGWALTPQQLAKATEKATDQLIEAVTTDESLTDDQVLDRYPGLVKRIHKALIARAKARTAAGQVRQPSDITPRPVQPSTEERKESRTATSAEFHKAMGLKGLRTL